jgi:hypothetical protein
MGKGAFEAAAERIALHQRHGDHRQVEGGVVAVDRLHRRMAVAHQGVLVAGRDQLVEQAEVAAEIEDAGDGRATDEPARRRQWRIGREELRDGGMHGGDVAQQFPAEAGAAGRPQAAPIDAALGIIGRVERLMRRRRPGGRAGIGRSQAGEGGEAGGHRAADKGHARGLV